jgi:hypothetical protein
MLSKKYKFIPVSDIMNIWNLNFTNKKPDTCFPIFQNKTSSTITNPSKKPPVKKNSGCLKPRLKIKDDRFSGAGGEDCVLKPRLKINDEDCVLKPKMKINDDRFSGAGGEDCVLKPRMKINDKDCVLKPRMKINDDRFSGAGGEDCVLKPRMKINDDSFSGAGGEDCVLKPRMKINDDRFSGAGGEDCVLKPRMKIKDDRFSGAGGEECVIQPVKVKDDRFSGAGGEEPEEDVEDTTIDDEIIGSIIKKILFNEDRVSIPTYLTNYLNSNKIAMNIEKIIEYDDIEDILQDINF